MRGFIARLEDCVFSAFVVLLLDATESTTLADEGVLANSVQQFSNVQGQDDWWYGYYDRSADANGIYDEATDFALMLYYRSDLLDPMVHQGADGRFPIIIRTKAALTGGALWANGGHPNATNTNLELWPIRRWVSNYEGEVNLTGNLAHLNLSYLGNGLRGRLFVDGTEIWTNHVNPTDSVGIDYSLQVPIHVGSHVDLAVDPEGDDIGDWAKFQVAITSVPEPSTLAFLGASAISLLAYVWRRQKPVM